MENDGEEWRKLEDQFMRPNVQTELPERHQRWQWAEKNRCSWQCAITETLGREGWGLQKGIWLIKRAKVAPHTDPALGLSNWRYLGGMIPLKAKQAQGHRTQPLWAGTKGCQVRLQTEMSSETTWSSWEWSEDGFWRLCQWAQKTAFSQLLLLLHYYIIYNIIYINNTLYYYYIISL